MRSVGALAVSLVAEERGETLGHVAFSPVTINGANRGWLSLGPLSVLPARQRRGIGAALVGAGLLRLRALGARGCVVLGDFAYYRRFGFAADPRLPCPKPSPTTLPSAPWDRMRRNALLAHAVR